MELFGTCGLAGRIGGDEFMAVLSVTDMEELKKQAEQLKKNPVVLECKGERVEIQFCAGAAVAAPGEDYQDLYRKTDQALYQAKEKGRGEIYLAG